DAMARLRAQRSSVLLLIGGAGSLREALEAQSRALGLGDHVKFLGFVPDAELPRYYQAADLFVLPTRELEGFGLVTVEALACGTAVRGTPVGAPPEILRALCPSLVFRGTTPEMMAEDLERILAAKECDPDAYARLRAACREHVERRYTWARAADELEGALGRVAAGRTVAPAETLRRRAGADAGIGCAPGGGPAPPGPPVPPRGGRPRRRRRQAPPRSPSPPPAPRRRGRPRGPPASSTRCSTAWWRSVARTRSGRASSTWAAAAVIWLRSREAAAGSPSARTSR